MRIASGEEAIGGEDNCFHRALRYATKPLAACVHLKLEVKGDVLPGMPLHEESGLGDEKTAIRARAVLSGGDESCGAESPEVESLGPMARAEAPLAGIVERYLLIREVDLRGRLRCSFLSLLERLDFLPDPLELVAVGEARRSRKKRRSGPPSSATGRNRSSRREASRSGQTGLELPIGTWSLCRQLRPVLFTWSAERSRRVFQRHDCPRRKPLRRRLACADTGG